MEKKRHTVNNRLARHKYNNIPSPICYYIIQRYPKIFKIGHLSMIPEKAANRVMQANRTFSTVPEIFQNRSFINDTRKAANRVMQANRIFFNGTLYICKSDIFQRYPKIL